MTYRQTIPSDFMSCPRLADLARRASAAPPAPAAQAAAPAGASEPLHPAFQRAIDALGDGRNRDVVRDAAEAEPAFAYRTDQALLQRLPEPARTLLKRLDLAATDARDTTVALSRHVDAASDRVGRASLDVRAMVQSARLPEVATLDDARRMAPADKWPPGYTEPMKATVRAIVTEGERLAEAHAEHAELVERRRQHAQRTAPLLALRQRLVEGAARLRPPIKELELPQVDTKKAERVIAEAREAIAEARAEIERIEGAPLHPADAEAEAARAVARHAERGSAHRFVKVSSGGITIYEPSPTHHVEDHPPIPPLALLAAVAPDALTRWMLAAIPTDPDAPRLADRPAMLAEARQKLRQAELTERAALAALGDPLEMFRSDADPLITLMVEAGR